MKPPRHRKSNRLKEYNYSQAGCYFITICTKDREELFGEVINGGMILNQLGKIVEKQLLWLANQYIYIELDSFVVMPNHVHAIIMICDISTVGTGRDLSLPPDTKIKSLSELIGAFKTTSSKVIHLNGHEHFLWQRSFYDHIIYHEIELIKIRDYIINNPSKWELDRNNQENLLM